jgi:hypothetical protein
MPVKNAVITVCYYASDTSGGKITDAGNHTLFVILDGTKTTLSGASASSIASVSDTDCPGLYKVTLTTDENNASVVTLHGKSSASGVMISPVTWTNDVNIEAISSGTSAASNLEAMFDNSGYNASASTIGTVTTVTNKTGYELHANGVDAIWNEVTTGHTTANSYGKALNLFFNAASTISSDFHLDSALGQILDNGGSWVFSRSTDSLQAIRDAGDLAWITAVPPTAPDIADAVWNETSTGHTGGGKAGDQLWTDIDAILLDTGTDGVKIGASAITTGSFTAGAINAAAIGTAAIDADAIATDAIGANELANGAVTKIWTSALAESYAADGAAGTGAQLLYMIFSGLGEFAISGTTLTAKKLDGSATAMTFTLDSATNPTSRTRAS